MFNSGLTRFSNRVSGFSKLRSATPFKNKSKTLKLVHKYLFRGSYYLSRQTIKSFRFKGELKRNYFMSQCFFNRLRKSKKIVRTCCWTYSLVISRTSTQKQLYRSWETILFQIFPKTKAKHFRYYWLNAFFKPCVTTRFYFYTNFVKFFLNQRLVKQPVLLTYSKTNKNNNYSNYLRVFRGLALKRPTNYVSFSRGLLFYVYPKFNSQSYFIRHTNFLRKFVNTSFLKN